MPLIYNNNNFPDSREYSTRHFCHDLELRGGDLISSPVDSIASLVSPKKVTDPTLWGKIIFRPRPFLLLAKMQPVTIMPNMALWGTKRSVLSP